MKDTEPKEKCKHEYRLLEKGKASYHDKYPDVFYCIFCLIKEYK